MSYTCRFLRFGDNHSHVPGYDQDLIVSNSIAPIPEMLIDPAANPAQPSAKDIWRLVFSYVSGEFFRASSDVPGQPDASTIKSWYAQGGPGPNSFCIVPFIVGASEFEGFAGSADSVHFSEQDGGTCVNTDSLGNPTVTATVKLEIPELARTVISSHSTNTAIITTTSTTRVVFDHRFFVYAGETVDKAGMPDNTLTVAKGHSCSALAVYRLVTTTTSHETGTVQRPKIPKSEWPTIAARLVREIVEKEGELLEYVSPKVLANTAPEDLRKAAADIDRKVKELERVKSVISGLAERPR